MEFLIFFLLVLVGMTFRYPMNIYAEVSWSQFLEIIAQEPQTKIIAGKTSSRRNAHAIFINGVWYVCFESITAIDRFTLHESRLLIVERIHGL